MATATPFILRECHRLRKHLRDLKDEIDRGPRVLKAQQARLAAEEQAHKEAHETIKKLKLQQKTDESTLKSLEQQLSKLQTRSMEVTTLKEMDAVKSEIAQATEKKNTLEDAILATMTDIEDRTANLPNVDKQWAEAQAEFRQYQIDAKERLERLLEDQKLSEADLQKWEKELPADMQSHYARLVKSYGPDGLAGVKMMVCQQCRQKLNETIYHQIEAGQFVCCSNCGRGLYIVGEG
jgi:predicted  nucleic acid-binding Zn-ribbon protein